MLLNLRGEYFPPVFPVFSVSLQNRCTRFAMTQRPRNTRGAQNKLANTPRWSPVPVVPPVYTVAGVQGSPRCGDCNPSLNVHRSRVLCTYSGRSQRPQRRPCSIWRTELRSKKWRSHSNSSPYCSLEPSWAVRSAWNSARWPLAIGWRSPANRRSRKCLAIERAPLANRSRPTAAHALTMKWLQKRALLDPFWTALNRPNWWSMVGFRYLPRLCSVFQ